MQPLAVTDGTYTEEQHSACTYAIRDILFSCRDKQMAVPMGMGVEVNVNTAEL